MAITDERGRTICELCGTIYPAVERRGRDEPCPQCKGVGGVNPAVLAKWGNDAQALLKWALDCRDQIAAKRLLQVSTVAFTAALERVATLSARIFFLLNQPAAAPATAPLDPKTDVFEEDEDEDEDDSWDDEDE